MVFKPIITFASLVWRPKMKQATSASRVKTCLAVAGAMRRTLKTLLNLPLLHLVMKVAEFIAENSQNYMGLGNRNFRVWERRNSKYFLRLYDTFNTKFVIKIAICGSWVKNSHSETMLFQTTWKTNG